MSELKVFHDNELNLDVARASIGDDYSISARIYNKWQSETVPFTYALKAVRNDRKIVLQASSKEMYEEYTNAMAKNLVKSVPGAIKTSFKDFVEIDQYMADYAGMLVGVPVKAIAKGKLGSLYGQNLNKEYNDYLNFFRSHAINITVRLEISNIYVDALLTKYECVLNNQPYYILVGCDYKGIEYYDANNTMTGINMMSMGLGGMFNGGLFTKKTNESNVNRDTSFGHYREGSRRCDVIQWGHDHMYACLYTPDVEKEAVGAFLNFAGSLKTDDYLVNQERQLVEAKFQQQVMQAQGYSQMANQSMINSMNLQRQVSANIAQMSRETSAGIMDSWNKKSASMDRMSHNYSEAIRGVNTYQGSNGSFEFDNVADHVYENQYGDHIGVSGNAPDDDTLNKLNWKEVFKK